MSSYRSILSLLVVCFIAAALPAALAQEESGQAPVSPILRQDSEKETLIKELLELSGLRAQLQYIRGNVLSRLSPGPGESRQEFEEQRQIFANAYDPGRLYETVRGYLRHHADKDRLRAVVEWLRSPSAREITEVEVENSGPDAMQGFQSFAARIRQNPPPQQRVALMRRFQRASRALEQALETDMVTFQGIIEAASRGLPPGRRPTAEQRQRLLAEMRAQLDVQIDQYGPTILLYNYQEASDEALEDYVIFLESDVGQWYVNITNRAMLSAMSAAARRAGNGMAQVLARGTIR
ncbi:hypothetical protein MYX77_00375 [Acidobacteriia bacterium AH_259_A11_L15]|nr:hypothetical protein [Acidobacteriia bacterium AH_259_A11_L15]